MFIKSPADCPDYADKKSGTLNLFLTLTHKFTLHEVQSRDAPETLNQRLEAIDTLKKSASLNNVSKRSF